MKANTSIVQIEAWKAKEKLYEMVKDIDPAEQMKKLISLGKPFLKLFPALICADQFDETWHFLCHTPDAP